MKTLIKLTLSFLLAITFALNVSATDNDDVREITITGTDNMKFDVTLIEAKPGERIRLTLKVISNMPKQAMQHNVAIIDLNTNTEDFVMASMVKQDNEYIAPDYEKNVIANTAMIGGGETTVIEFTVPEKTGDYTYVCTFPGHYFGGMKGILRVE